MGDVPHKSPGPKALVIPNSDTKKKKHFLDAFAFTSFLELDVWQHLPRWHQRGLLHHEFWRGTGNCTAACTNLKENVQYKKLGIINSDQLSGIDNLDSSSTNPTVTVFFTGNAPKNLHVNNCYMAETVDCGHLLKTFASRWHVSLSREKITWLLLVNQRVTIMYLCAVISFGQTSKK